MENNKLENKKQKIFAGNTTEAQQQIAVYGSKAETGTMTFSKDPDKIQSNNWSNGWGSATILDQAPFQEDFNSIEYVNSYNIAYLQQRGIAEYNPEITYYKGSIVSMSDVEGKPTLYYSKIDNNTGNNPTTTEEEYWALLNNGGGGGGGSVSVSSRNIGEVVYSMLPIDDEGLHQADGSLISQTGEYQEFCEYLKNLVNGGTTTKQVINANVEGTVKVSDDLVASNLSTAGKIELPEVFNPDTATSFEVVFKFTTGATFSTNQELFTQGFQSENTSSFWIRINTDKKIECWFSFGDGTYNPGGGTGSTVLTANTTYWWKWSYALEGNNGVWKTFLSTNGVDWTQDSDYINNYSTHMIIPTTAYTPKFGGYISINNDTIFNGSIDFKECYIKIEGNYFWQGTKTVEEKLLDIDCTQEEWDNYFTTYGFCPKFVIDNEAGNVRLPYLKGYMKGVNSLQDLGKINEEELPNVKTDIDSGVWSKGVYGNNPTPFYNNGSERYAGTSSGPANKVGIDLSLKNPIYKNGGKVQPEGYNCLIYIVLANSTVENVSAIKDYQVYNTVPLGCPIYSDHMLNDVNYLLSNNQWNDGTVYKDMYNLLVSEYNNPASTEETDWYLSMPVVYKLTPLKYKITTYYLEDSDNYYSNYWRLDIENKRFKLPENVSRKFINSIQLGTSKVNFYSDGYVEQFYQEYITNGYRKKLHYPMKYDNYYVSATNMSTAFSNIAGVVKEKTHITFTNSVNNALTSYCVSGYVDFDALSQSDKNQIKLENFLYYKVGNTTVNADLIDIGNLTAAMAQKADTDGSNLTRGLKFVEEFDIKEGDTEVIFNNVYDKYTHIIEIQDLTATGRLSNNFPIIKVGKDGVDNTANIFGRTLIQQVTNNNTGIFSVNDINPGLYISYNIDDYISAVRDYIRIEITGFKNSYISCKATRIINFDNDIRTVRLIASIENSNQNNYLKLTSNFVSQQPFKTGHIKHYIIK